MFQRVAALRRGLAVCPCLSAPSSTPVGGLCGFGGFRGTRTLAQQAGGAAAAWVAKPTPKARKVIRHKKSGNVELEQQSRLNELVVEQADCSAMSDSEWREYRGHIRLRTMAKQLDVYKHVFGMKGSKVWAPMKQLLVDYGSANVHRGNLLTPEQTATAPSVSFTNDEHNVTTSYDSLYTLMMVSPDGPMGKDMEVFVHWMITNVPDTANIADGDCIVDYLPPMPLEGMGHHRYVYLLLKQKRGQIAFEGDHELVKSGGASLGDRQLDIPAFASRHMLAPQGMAIFQAAWDPTVDVTLASIV